MADIKNTVIAFFQAKGEIPGETETERLACAYLEVPLIDSMGIMEMILDLRLIPLYFFQSVMRGPKVL